MTPADPEEEGACHRRLAELFHQALALPAAERQAFLAGAAGDDEALRQEVLAMLAAHGAEEGFLEFPLADTVLDSGGDAEDGGLPGRSTIGEFRLLRVLGQGGGGTVYLAHQPSLDRHVAVKVLAAAGFVSDVRQERFRREGPTAGRLHHPGIVQVHQVGEEEGVPFIVMDFVEGESLATEMQRLGAASGPPSRLAPGRAGAVAPLEAARIARDLARALAHAHAHGVIHRDVKPGNVLLDQELQPRLADFGLARFHLEKSITRSGQIEGTPNYMSPEQVRALRDEIDARTDVYSLGVVLYELLTGVRPFEAADHLQVMRNVTTRVPRPLRRENPDVPADLATICHRAIEKRREDRYAGAAALADDLQRFLDHRSIVARPLPAAVRGLRWGQSNRGRLAAAGALLAGVIGGPAVQAAWIERRAEDELVARCAALEQLEGEERALGLRELVQELERLAGLRGGGSERLARARTLLDGLGARDVRAIEDELRRLWIERGDDAPARMLELAWRLGHYRVAGVELHERLSALLAVEVDRSALPEAAGLRLLVQPRDEASGVLGEARPLEDALLGGDRLPAGCWQITAIGADGSFAELVALLDPREGPLRAELRPRQTPEATAGMVLVAGAAIEWSPVYEDAPSADRPRTLRVEVAPFLVDGQHVTNGAYAAFLEELGPLAPQPPAHWAWLADERPADWAERPVTGVRLVDARRFAAHHGKRLLTAAEWQLLACGAELRAFPWGEDAGQRLDGLEYGQDPSAFGAAGLDAQERHARWYLAHVRSVDAEPPELATAHGVRGLWSNVREWVDGCPVAYADGRLRPRTRAALRLGLACSDPEPLARGAGMKLASYASTEQGAVDLGFRCARSAEPPSIRGDR